MNKQIQAAKELPFRISKWSRSRGVKDALRSALAFTIGQLLCFLPGYDNLWRALRVRAEKTLLMFLFAFERWNPISLADQAAFTILAGVSRPTGLFTLEGAPN
jgi:hypothetical protein